MGSWRDSVKLQLLLAKRSQVLAFEPRVETAD